MDNSELMVTRKAVLCGPFVRKHASRLKGKVQEVRTGEMVMEVERAEGAGALTKGTHSIPTAKMSTVKVTSYKGKAKVVVALITGGVGGLISVGL